MNICNLSQKILSVHPQNFKDVGLEGTSEFQFHFSKKTYSYNTLIPNLQVLARSIKKEMKGVVDLVTMRDPEMYCKFTHTF